MSGRGQNKNDQQQILLDIHVGEGVGGEPGQHRGEARAGQPGGHQRQHCVGGQVTSAGHQQRDQKHTASARAASKPKIRMVSPTMLRGSAPMSNARH